MTFLSPLFLLGALTAAIPILLHLLKRQPEIRVKFGAVDLLKSAPVETSQRQRLRELLLLALRVAGLLLLTLAFARPFLASGAAATGGGTTVVALDTSLSMSAPGRFERARQLATDAIQSAPSRDQTALVLFDTAARVADPLTANHASTLAAIARAQPGLGSTRYRVGLSASADLLRGGAGRIVVVTDLQASGWDAGDRAVVPPGAQVDVVDIGILPTNLAVASVRVADARIAASVINNGAAPREARLQLRVHPAGGAAGVTAPAAETTIPVGAGQRAEASFAMPSAEWAVVSVDDPGGIAGDNSRYVVLDTASRPTVMIVTASGERGREGFYVEQALLASGVDGNGYDVETVSGSALQQWDQPRVDAHTAVILLSTRGLDHHGRDLLSAYAAKGGGLLVAAGGDMDGEVVSDLLGGLASIAPPADEPRAAGARTLAPIDTRHPVLRVFAGRASLSLVRFQRVSALRAPNCQTLARFTSGEPALVDCAPGEGRALVLASDLAKGWNDFPLHATFVPFLHETMQYLARTRRSADYLIGDAPAGLPAVPGVAPYTQLPGAAPRLVAVNVDPAEADAARLTADEFQTAVTRSAQTTGAVEQSVARDQEERQHIWQYVLIVMIGAMIMESVVAARTA